MSVEPERGSPTMKIGSRASAPAPSRRAKRADVQTSICALVLRS